MPTLKFLLNLTSGHSHRQFLLLALSSTCIFSVSCGFFPLFPGHIFLFLCMSYNFFLKLDILDNIALWVLISHFWGLLLLFAYLFCDWLDYFIEDYFYLSSPQWVTSDFVLQVVLPWVFPWSP